MVFRDSLAVRDGDGDLLLATLFDEVDLEVAFDKVDGLRIGEDGEGVDNVGDFGGGLVVVEVDDLAGFINSSVPCEDGEEVDATAGFGDSTVVRDGDCGLAAMDDGG